jgi:5-methylcytosine-specific restriction endonuclease McrA
MLEIVTAKIKNARARRRRWNANHKEEVKKKLDEWRNKNRDRVNENRRRWLSENPEKNITYLENRRARKLANGGTITEQEWKDLCEKYGNRCLRCGRTDVKLTLDHVIPLESGGSNTIGNAQPLCGKCNSAKGTKTIDYRGKYG